MWEGCIMATRPEFRHTNAARRCRSGRRACKFDPAVVLLSLPVGTRTPQSPEDNGMMDYVDSTTVASDSTSTALTGDAPAMTGEDPALLKLVRKIEACDAVEDAEERRRFVAKHANSFGLSVADVLSRLRVRGTLSAEEVNSHNSHNTHARSHARTHARTRARTHARTRAHMPCMHTQV